MSFAAAKAPIKIGVLTDIIYPTGQTWDMRTDTFDAIRLTFDEAIQSRMIDRPVELVTREVEGLPRGAAKAVVDVVREMIEIEGCIAIIGPMISENCIAVRDYIEREGRTPCIAWCGTDEWLGEWTFHLSNGSLPDEPHVIANVMAHDNIKRVGVTYEDSLIGKEYLEYFRRACKREGLTIAGEIAVSQTAAGDLLPQVKDLHDRNPDALLHLGFGFGLVGLNGVLKKLNWSPPKYTITSLLSGYMYDDFMREFFGWVGLDQFDEGNPVAMAFLDRFEARFGRRPEYFVIGVAHDLANAVAHALADAHPLTAIGVKNAFERIKMLPAASGEAGTRISFGKWTRRGWMGEGYLVARMLDPNNLRKSIFKAHYRLPKPESSR